MIDPPVMVVVPVYVFALPRISTPPPALVMFWEPLMTPERMPAVIIVPVLPLLLTVMVRAAVPRLMLLVISVSPSAVPEPSTSEVVFAKPAVVPQVRSALAVAPTPSDTTKRAGVPEAKPAVLARETVPVPATEAARERVNVEPATSSTPPSSVIGLLVGIPTTSPLTIARSWPPLMVVMPV